MEVEIEVESDLEEVTESSDAENEVEQQDPEDEFEVGDVVWALWQRRYYAAKIVSLADVPEQFHRQLRSASSDYLIVRYYADGMFNRVHRTKVDTLAENVVDKQRARFNPQAYNEALADLVYD